MVIKNLEKDSEKALKQMQERLVNSGLIRRGEYVVMLAGQPFFARGSTNFIEVEKVA
jgi:pyruvate kinase